RSLLDIRLWLDWGSVPSGCTSVLLRSLKRFIRRRSVRAREQSPSSNGGAEHQRGGTRTGCVQFATTSSQHKRLVSVRASRVRVASVCCFFLPDEDCYGLYVSGLVCILVRERCPQTVLVPRFVVG